MITRPGEGRPTRFLALSWVGWLNVLVLQWLFVRLAYHREDGQVIGWSLLKGIVPLTGWRGGYVRVGFVLAWYDFWVGAYFDRDNRELYLMVPFVGVRFSLEDD